MTIVKFTTNLNSNTSKPWVFNPNDFNGIPSKGGVYIVGVKIITNGQGEKFCPLYVGTYKSDIKTRIRGHWDADNTNIVQGSLNSFKELFDLELDPTLFYPDIELWNQHWKGKNNSTKNLENLFNQISTIGNNTLIWFPNPIFFQRYLKNSSIYINPASNWHNNTTKPSSLPIGLLKKKIEDVKNIITTKFYYVSAEIEDDRILTTIEDNVNYKLRTFLKIPTYAKSHLPKANIQIDLSVIQNELVNMTGVPFTNPLII